MRGDRIGSTFCRVERPPFEATGVSVGDAPSFVMAVTKFNLKFPWSSCCVNELEGSEGFEGGVEL